MNLPISAETAEVLMLRLRGRIQDVEMIPGSSSAHPSITGFRPIYYHNCLSGAVGCTHSCGGRIRPPPLFIHALFLSNRGLAWSVECFVVQSKQGHVDVLVSKIERAGG